MMRKRKVFLILLVVCICTTNGLMAQSTMKVRIAKIVVDSAYLTEYRAALAEHAATAVKVEPQLSEACRPAISNSANHTPHNPSEVCNH